MSRLMKYWIEALKASAPKLYHALNGKLRVQTAKKKCTSLVKTVTEYVLTQVQAIEMYSAA